MDALSAAARSTADTIRADPALVGPAKNCSPRHQMPFSSGNEGSRCMSMSRLVDVVARHVVQYQLTQETRVQNACR